eukprot:CAMPEP_0182525266 /NCGR_PEP_ID=MMETSP1323-20130603/2361_1 /TAXON_ID=236787 /ORGANISM="Florenciella parvula, Strain RCC1693" /LENGTH=154 /DNA_ID=CAMNT_0024733967 /DNA_START=389 /DNA_END=853 /DNA_ORIENTATION=+
MSTLSKLTEAKKAVDDSLKAIEKQIFDLEETYFNETPNGNVIKGWGEFLDAKPTQAPPSLAAGQKRKMEKDNRMFSYSSWTFWTENPLMNENIKVEAAISEAPVTTTSSGRSHKKTAVSREASRQDLMEEDTESASKREESKRKKKRRKKDDDE